jgi:hypothetical protein
MYLIYIAYIFERNTESFHYIHDNACGRSWSAHSAMNINTISVRRLSIECIHCLIYLICCPIRLGLFSLQRCISLGWEGGFNWIKQSCRFQFKLLSLIQFHLGLEDIIYQWVGSWWVLVEILLFLKCCFNKIIRQWKTHLYLYIVWIFDIYSQILDI